jgi:hypothetical protein
MEQKTHKYKQEAKAALKAKKRALILEMRRVHNQLIAGEHPQKVSSILNALIFLFELREHLK